MTVLTSIVGITGLAAGVQDWLRCKTLLHECIMLIVGGLFMAYPGVMTDTAGIATMGIAITGIAAGLHLIRTRS